jgi:hypothetical protein
VEDRIAEPVHAGELASARVRECQPTARIREHDLASVEMSCEDESKGACRQPANDAREVTEKDAQVRRGIGQPLGLGAASPVAPGVDADELNTAATNLHHHGLVLEQTRIAEVVELHSGREGIARDGDVVVSEDDERPAELVEELAQQSLAAWVREEIASHTNQLGIPSGDPLGRAAAGELSPSGSAEMEVGEVRDPDAVERAW